MAGLLITDPIDLLLDEDGDIVVDSDLHLASGVEGIVQAIRTELLLFLGEWFWDLDKGVPYEDMLGQRYNETRSRAIFREKILAVEGVVDVLSLSAPFTPVTRTMSVAWAASTVFGVDTDGVVEV